MHWQRSAIARGACEPVPCGRQYSPPFGDLKIETADIINPRSVTVLKQALGGRGVHRLFANGGICLATASRRPHPPESIRWDRKPGGGLFGQGGAALHRSPQPDLALVTAFQLTASAAAQLAASVYRAPIVPI